MSETITRERLKAKKERRYDTVEIEGDIYRMQSLNAYEKSKYQSMKWSGKDFTVTPETFERAKRHLVAMVLVDKDGNRLFDDSQIEELKDYDCGWFDEIFEACERHIGKQKDESKKLVGESDATTS